MAMARSVNARRPRGSNRRAAAEWPGLRAAQVIQKNDHGNLVVEGQKILVNQRNDIIEPRREAQP